MVAGPNDSASPATQPPAATAREHHVLVTRTARYFTLGPEDDSAREGWFVLHGYGNLAERFLRAFAPLVDGTRLIVAPEALNRFYLTPPSKAPASERTVGASWMTKEDRAHEIEDYVAYLDAVADAVLARVAGEAAERVVVLGFSQATATASRWVASGRIRPRDLILWGGTLPPELELERRDHALRHVSLRFVVGSADEYATPKLVGDQENRLRAAGMPYELDRFEGGHVIEPAALRTGAAKVAAR